MRLWGAHGALCRCLTGGGGAVPFSAPPGWVLPDAAPVLAGVEHSHGLFPQSQKTCSLKKHLVSGGSVSSNVQFCR